MLLLGKISVKEGKRMFSGRLAAARTPAHITETGAGGWIARVPSLLHATHKLKPQTRTGQSHPAEAEVSTDTRTGHEALPTGSEG